jgi:hypothetical protein
MGAIILRRVSQRALCGSGILRVQTRNEWGDCGRMCPWCVFLCRIAQMRISHPASLLRDWERSTVMNSQPGKRDWRFLAEQTCRETDSAKLAMLVGELCRALDGEHEKSVQRLRQRPAAGLSRTTDAPFTWQDTPVETPTLEMICGDEFKGRCSACKAELDAAASAQQLLNEFDQHVREKHRTPANRPQS